MGPSEIAPWLLPRAALRLDLTQYDKREVNPQLLRASFGHVVSKYPGYEIIYTDGSKTDRGVGAAFHASGQTHSWSLS